MWTSRFLAYCDVEIGDTVEHWDGSQMTDSAITDIKVIHYVSTLKTEFEFKIGFSKEYVPRNAFKLKKHDFNKTKS